MGDAGDELIDAELRMQERMEELERERTTSRARAKNPEQARAIESLKSLELARRELEGQLGPTTHERRRAQIAQALAEIDRRMAIPLSLSAEGTPDKG